MSVKQRTVQFSSDADMNPSEIERVLQHYDDVLASKDEEITSLTARVAALETAAADVEARLTGHGI